MSSTDTNIDFSESKIQAQNTVGIEVRAENEFLDTWNCLPAPGLSQGSGAVAVEKISFDGENKVGPGKSKSDFVLVNRGSCQHSGESIDLANASSTSISCPTRPLPLGTSQGKREGSSGNPGHVVRIVVGDRDLKKISETVSPRFLINLFPCSLPCRCCCGRRRELRRVKESNVSMTLEENRRSYRSCVGVKRKLAATLPGDPPVKNGSLNGHYCENNNLVTKAAPDEAVKDSGEKQDDSLSCFRESRKKRKSKRKHRQRSRGSSTSTASEIRPKSARGTSGSPKSQERHHRRSSKKSGRKSSNAKHKKAKRSRHRDSSVKRKSSKSKKKKKRHRRRRSRSTPPKTVRASQQLVACCYQSESGSEDEVPCGTETVDSQPDSSLLIADAVANIQEPCFDQGNEKVLATSPAVAVLPNDAICVDEDEKVVILAGDRVEVGNENNTGADEPEELNSENIANGTGQTSSTNDTLEDTVQNNMQGESSTFDKESIRADTEAPQDVGQNPSLGNTAKYAEVIPISEATVESIGTEEQENADVPVPEEHMPEENTIPIAEVKTPLLLSSPSSQYQVSTGDKIIIEMNGMHTGSSPHGREGVKISIEPITSVEMDSLGQSSLLCSASGSEKPMGSSPLGPTQGSRSRSVSSSSSSSYRSRTRSTKSYRSYSSRSYSSSRSRSRSSASSRSAASHRTKSRSASFSSQSRSRSRSRSSRSRTRSRTRSVSKSSRSKSRSVSRSVTRSRSRSPVKPVKKARSRSRSIPRRRGSPSFLERRRITSARKRPISYKRKPGSEWEVSSDSESSDSSL